MLFGIFARKPLDVIKAEAGDESAGFSRSLNGLNILLLGIGGIIGAGIFVLTGQASAQYAGPAILISFILSGIACTFAALCYAELAAMIPVAGSAYTYAYATLGQLIAWIIGWDLILEYLFGASTVAVGWSGYIVSFLRDFGITIPAALSSAPLNFVHGHEGQPGEWVKTGAIINLPAMFIVSLCSMLLYVGIRESAKFNNAIVVIKLTVLSLFIVFGAMHGGHIGYWIDQSYANKGYTSRAVSMLTEFGLETLDLHRIEINLRPENDASKRVAEKCGYIFEGIRPRYLHIAGAWRDHLTYVKENPKIK
jgi:APA family basic amino acid/polyamine antiporter